MDDQPDPEPANDDAPLLRILNVTSPPMAALPDLVVVDGVEYWPKP